MISGAQHLTNKAKNLAKNLLDIFEQRGISASGTAVNENFVSFYNNSKPCGFLDASGNGISYRYAMEDGEIKNIDANGQVK